MSFEVILFLILPISVLLTVFVLGIFTLFFVEISYED